MTSIIPLCQAMLSNALSGFRMSQPVKLPA
jgi:hypothetical protein